MRGHRACRCGTTGSVRRLCRYRFCTEWCCVQCGQVKFSAGPAGCKCSGPPVRWLWFPDMDVKQPAALKPSAKRRNPKPKPMRRRLNRIVWD